MDLDLDRLQDVGLPRFVATSDSNASGTPSTKTKLANHHKLEGDAGAVGLSHSVLVPDNAESPIFDASKVFVRP